MFVPQMKIGRVFGMAAAFMLGALLVAAPAAAQRVPDKITQEVVIKSILLTFNDANVTGNYTVLHAKLSKPFRDQFPPERLKDVFKVFNEKHIDIDIIAAKPPIASQEPKVSETGTLLLYGYFETAPSRVFYEL